MVLGRFTAGGSSALKIRMALMLIVPALAALGMASPASAGGPRCFGKLATIVGSGGDDNITGTPGPDVIVARSGDDDLGGRGGKDRICGGSGEDVINGGTGADRMKGQRHIDFLAGGDGDDLHLGGADGDTIFADVGNAAGSDVAKGGPGDDFIDVEDLTTNDTARGGPGPDTCNFDTGDTVTGCP